MILGGRKHFGMAEILQDEPCSDRSITSRIEENTTKVDTLIRSNLHLTIRMIGAELDLKHSNLRPEHLENQCKISLKEPIPRDFIIIIVYPWPSHATSPYRSSPLAGLQGYIPYPHIAAVFMFELVVLLLLGHMRGSIRVHHWWVRPCFSSSVLHVWFV